MIATKKVFFVLFAAFPFLPALAAAQITAPAPISDTSKQVDTAKKSVFTLRTIGMAPVYLFEINDNAKIEAAHQFPGARPLPDSCYYPGEHHLKNIRQLTFEGVNTRPVISPDDNYLAFQAHGEKPNSCDQIYRMPLTGVPASRISSGKGRATGVAFLSGNELLFSSTEAVNGGACPGEPKDGVWPMQKGSNLYTSDSNEKQLQPLTKDEEHFDGDASVSPNGDRILFTSTRTGEAELFSMKADGSDVKQLTQGEGFNGDAAFSPSGNEIVLCESHPKGRTLAEYKTSLEKGYIDPAGLEIYVMNTDGTNKRPVTHLSGTCYAPHWAPDGEHIVFSSKNFLTGNATDLFMIRKDGTDLERITFGRVFDGFAEFSRDGTKLVFCSNRNASHPNDINLFVADWVP
ncbi:MAG: TolB family protein [Candidatus Kapaibacterium sp.]